MSDTKNTGRLIKLRKFIGEEEDEKVVKEMVEDGLSDDQILHALGYVNGAPDTEVLPEDHEYSQVPTDDQLQQQQNQQMQQQQQGQQGMQALASMLSGAGGQAPGGQQAPQQGGQAPVPPRR
jgi:hypothetical protein